MHGRHHAACGGVVPQHGARPVRSDTACRAPAGALAAKENTGRGPAVDDPTPGPSHPG